MATIYSQYFEAHKDNQIYKDIIQACIKNKIVIAKNIVYHHKAHAFFDMDIIFRMVCYNDLIDMAKWLVHNYQVDVHKIMNMHLYLHVKSDLLK
jgi:hypothetical protein